MGMAAYGRPRLLDRIRQMVDVCEDGSLRLDMRYFEFHRSTRRMFGDRFVNLLGQPPRPPAAPVHLGERDGSSIGDREQFYADVAASIQVLTEEVVVAMAREAHRTTGMKRLCFAGGVALNGLANAAILDRTPFEELYIPSSPGDGGGALGAALYAEHVLLGRRRSFVQEHGYWGRDFSDSEVRQTLLRRGVRFEHVDDEDAVCRRAVEELTRGRVLAWFQGRFEWGP